MAELGIDQSKLPGVKEVCRDFAILEDHTLAHNLQEQEIEHHLATNIQRNRLVQYDLQVAKQLQEEEDRKARSRIQERHKNMELQDCEIAQEIQVKLVIEAEQKRRQEEDDEDIARILQQKELREDKRRRKPPPSETSRHSPYGEGCYLESREEMSCGPREPATDPARPRPTQQARDHRRGPPLVLEGLDLEVLGSTSEVPKDGRTHDRERQEQKPGRPERPRRPPRDTAADEDVGWGQSGNRGYGERRAAGRERTQGAAALIQDGEEPRALRGSSGSRERCERRPRSRERPPPRALDWEADDRGRRHHGHRESRSPSSEKGLRPPRQAVEMEGRSSEGWDVKSQSPDPGYRRWPREDHRLPPTSHEPRTPDSEASHQRGRRREAGRGREGAGSPRPRAPPSLPPGEHSGTDQGHRRAPGTKSKGAKEAAYHKPRVSGQDQESYDVEIARKIQEEELWASHMDKRVAQVAQDEEIARLLMAEEKAAYRKAREREKWSSDQRRQNQDWKHNTHELVRPRSREDSEGQRHRSDKPTWPPPPPAEDPGHQNLTCQSSKSESSHKGHHYKQ